MQTKKEDLSKFFAPKSIAIIGASSDESKVGGIILKKALKSKAEIIPINPKHDSIFGKKCYPSVLNYKNKIDLAVIAIPAEFVPMVLKQCGIKKIKNAIIISAGFSEAGNKKAEQNLIAISKKYSIRFIGTNCFGICNPHLKLDLTFSASTPNKGNIAFISQSGALWSYISDFSFGKELGFSSFVSLGNMEDLGFNEFIKYFSLDKKTKSLVLYIESLKDGRNFIELCRKLSQKKKIFAVKGGSSQIGMKAEFSHTASLASQYEIYKGAFRQAKIELCESLLTAFEKASGTRLINKNKEIVKIGRKLFIITNAGGAGVLLSDYLSKKGFSILENPLDIFGTASAKDYFSALNSTKSKNYDSLIVILTPQSMTQIKETAESIVRFQKSSKKRIIALFLGGKKVKEADMIFEKAGISHFNTLEEARDSLEF